MGIVKSVVRTQAVRVHEQVKFMGEHPHKFQEATFKTLLNSGKQTLFGKDHNFKEITNSKEYAQRVPLQTYADLQPYMDKIIDGEASVLWPGRPKYLVKTRNGNITPVSKTSLPYHFTTAKYAIFNYVMKYGLLDTFNGKFLYIADSIDEDNLGKYKVKNMSSVLNENIPTWLRFNQLPKTSTNSIANWEEKLEKIVDETLNENLTMLNGVPAHTVPYLEKILERSKTDTVLEVFPHLTLHVHGGLSFREYEKHIDRLVGKHLDTIELYPMSEGIVAFQDDRDEQGLLLNVNGGMYFEFIPIEDYRSTQPQRLTLEDVEKDKDYVLVISTSAGIYSLDTEDIVRFNSVHPFRVEVIGKVNKDEKVVIHEEKKEVFDLDKESSQIRL